ncbi:hypothetical protein FACS1894190_08140 [Spirochaetia bacterium]|nr:hypothetical protein FACS1894190_08140 [Spirochaetia bacterium]
MNIGYQNGQDIYYPQIVRLIKKNNKTLLQPIFEAFTNSIEAIKNRDNGFITITLYVTKDLHGKEMDLSNFQKVVIQDNGVGFNDDQFNRLLRLYDNRKGYSNRGTGRLQFLHFFNETKITSIYKEKDVYKIREFVLSKAENFLKNNAIVRLDREETTNINETSTILTFLTPLNTSDKKNETVFFNSLKAEQLRDEIIKHYLPLFCGMKNNFPDISINTVIDNKNIQEKFFKISATDIPDPDKKDISIEINYSKIEGNKTVYSTSKETFSISAFCLPEKELEYNAIKLVSKHEIAQDMKLDSLLPQDIIDGKRYLFFISSDYIDNKDTDTRGQINILTTGDYIKRNNNNLDLEEEILFDDIVTITNQKILSLYPEIGEWRKRKDKEIEELRKMFLLNQKTLDGLKFSIDTSVEDILYAVYKKDAELVAQKDAVMRNHIKDIQKLTPNKNDYQEKLLEQVNVLVKNIPLQNRTALTQYIARRQIVLAVFDTILNNEQKKVELGGRIDEKILHNLIFQQSSSNPDESDLWLINEEFIYFKGASEQHLSDIQYNGKNIMKDKSTLTVDEKEYLNSFKKKRLKQKPDVLLFPDEGKAIIIEFKAPDVDVSEYIGQVDFYANLLRNYTIDEFQITTFYGYLIGESIDNRDVLGHVPYAVHSYQFDYWFRPAAPVHGFSPRNDGSIYLEIIKYSTLLKRAIKRNEIFMKKLGIDNVGFVNENE